MRLASDAAERARANTALDLWANGLTAAQILELLDYSCTHCVYNLVSRARRRGDPRATEHPTPGRPLTTAARVAELVQRGFTYGQIAAMGVCGRDAVKVHANTARRRGLLPPLTAKAA